MIMIVVQRSNALVKMHMAFFYFNIRACDYGIVVHMTVIFRSITGHIVGMTVKIGVFGSNSGIFMEMSGLIAGLAAETVSVQLVIHNIHPLLSVYAGEVLLDSDTVKAVPFALYLNNLCD